jgi:hypothetical protein
MIKKIISALCLMILVACNQYQSKPAFQAGAIATSVAKTLTAHASTTVPIMGRTPTPRQQIASNTPQTENTATPTPTSTITSTAPLSPITTNTSTYTPEDPKLSLGTPTRLLSLEDGKAFGISGDFMDDFGNSISVSNGMLTLHNPKFNGFLIWRLTTTTSANFYIEAVFQTVNCDGSDQYGITIRSPDYENGYGYYFGITCDGNYLLTRRDASGISIIVAATPSSQIIPGKNQMNRIGIWADGSKFKLYANSKLLQETNDSGISTGGHYGPFMIGQSGNLTVNLDQISYWSLP